MKNKIDEPTQDTAKSKSVDQPTLDELNKLSESVGLEPTKSESEPPKSTGEKVMNDYQKEQKSGIQDRKSAEDWHRSSIGKEASRQEDLYQQRTKKGPSEEAKSALQEFYDKNNIPLEKRMAGFRKTGLTKEFGLTEKSAHPSIDRAAPYRKFGPEYDRTISDRAARLELAIERGHDQKIIDHLAGELTMSIDALEQRKSERGIASKPDESRLTGAKPETVQSQSQAPADPVSDKQESKPTSLDEPKAKKPFVYPNGQIQTFDESPKSADLSGLTESRKSDSEAAARIEKSTEVINALPEGVGKRIATKMMEDFGEKLTGARKHSASPKNRKSATVKEDDRPGWQRRYDVNQITKSTNKEEEGKFAIYDTKQKDWFGQHKMAIRKLFDSHEEAMEHLPLIEVGRNHRIYKKEDGKYAISRVLGDKRPTVKGGFETEEDAMKYMAKNPHEIIEHKFPSYEDYQYLDNVVRDGKSVRKSDVTGSQFAKAFGFRGGEFGNWQAGADGQKSLNHAYDAMHDLATVLGLEPSHVGLNGDLAIAFGARGSGGKNSARAHYEPGQRVMNLTKMKGAGSLAHEWLHALDHMIAGGKQSGLTSSIAIQSRHLQHTRPEVKEAIEKLRDVISTTSEEYIPDGSRHEAEVNKTQDSMRRNFDSLEQDWTSTYGKKNKKQLTPAELTEWNHLKEKVIRGDAGEKTYIGRRSRFGGTPSYEAIDRMNELHKKVTGRTFHKSTGDQKLYWNIERQRIAKMAVDEANQKKPKTRNRSTEFVKNAQKLDETRASSYYTKYEELMARAFEAFVEDKLKSNNVRSDYLIGKGKTASGFWESIGMASPFPQGEERKRINEAFEKLFDTLKGKEFKPSKEKYSASQQALTDRFTLASISHRFGLLTTSK